MKKNLVWLASYPKSGNTWFRIFLSNLLKGTKEAPDINDLERTPIASCRSIFDDYTGLEASDLTRDEIQNLRPHVFSMIAENSEETSYHKVHDAFTKNADGEWIFPPDSTMGAIYFIRNPLDVAVSFSYHNSCPLDKMIKGMADENYCLCPNIRGIANQLYQHHLSWSGHARSWTKAPIDVCVMRYEDMKLNTFETFKKSANFLKLNKTDEEIRTAIELSSFDVLRKQEEKNGFHEKPLKAEYFFREGRIATWKKHLTAEQIALLIENHREVMLEFGYIDCNGNLIFS